MPKGTVLAYSTSAGAGVIEDSGGERHYFNKADWQPSINPVADTKINFTASAGGAKNIKLRGR